MFFKVTGKIMLALLLLFAFQVAISIPLAVIGAVLAPVQPGEAVEGSDIAAQLSSVPLLNTITFTLSSAATIAAALAMYFSFKSDRSWGLGWKQERWLSKWMIGLGLGILFIGCGFLMIILLGGVRIVGASFTTETIYALGSSLILFTAVGLSEEIFCRGYVYGLVKKHGGIASAVIVSSLVFALLHSMNAAVFSNGFPMLNLMLAGVMFALLREASGGLWMPIGVHITWNFFQGSVLGMAVSGIQLESIVQLDILEPSIAGGAFGLEGSFVNTIVSAIVCIVLIVRCTQSYFPSRRRPFG